jgi:hypothetical protein
MLVQDPQARGCKALKYWPVTGRTSKPHNVSRFLPSGRTLVRMACARPKGAMDPPCS